VANHKADEDSEMVSDTPDWIAHTSLRAEKALPLMTLDAAYALFRDEKVGKLADAVVLSVNPITVDPEAIKDLNVCITMVGRPVEFCAQRRENVCPAP
jgi:predicted amidohydrolase YtcJ